MSKPEAPARRVRDLVFWPAVVTLAVTLLRHVGELAGWSPRLFSREPGVAAAFSGIVWLVVGSPVPGTAPS